MQQLEQGSANQRSLGGNESKSKLADEYTALNKLLTIEQRQVLLDASKKGVPEIIRELKTISLGSAFGSPIQEVCYNILQLLKPSPNANFKGELNLGQRNISPPPGFGPKNYPGRKFNPGKN